MLSLVLVTESEQTQRFITTLIVALLVFAGLLFLITLWYWRHTSPKRRVRRVLQPAGVGPDVDLRRPAYPDGADPRFAAQPGAAQPGYAGQQGGYDPRRDPRSQVYDPRSVDGRGYDTRGADGRGLDPRYASPAGGDPYGSQQGEPRWRLLQDDEGDPYGYPPARRH